MLCLDQCGAKDLLTTLCLIKRQANNCQLRFAAIKRSARPL
jgi:hypothetical protein